MENASKALIIAGEVVIGVLVVSLIAVVIATFGRFSFNMNSRIEQNRVLIFNNHFTTYDGRIDITAQEIAGLINFAKQSNDNYELDAYGKTTNGKVSPYFVDVFIDDKGFFYNNASYYSNTKEFSNKVLQFISQNNENLYYCNVDILNTKIVDRNILIASKDNNDLQYDQTTGMINKIVFHKIKEIAHKPFNVKNRNDYEIK